MVSLLIIKWKRARQPSRVNGEGVAARWGSNGRGTEHVAGGKTRSDHGWIARDRTCRRDRSRPPGCRCGDQPLRRSRPRRLGRGDDPRAGTTGDRRRRRRRRARERHRLRHRRDRGAGRRRRLRQQRRHLPLSRLPRHAGRHTRAHAAGQPARRLLYGPGRRQPDGAAGQRRRDHRSVVDLGASRRRVSDALHADQSRRALADAIGRDRAGAVRHPLQFGAAGDDPHRHQQGRPRRS